MPNRRTHNEICMEQGHDDSLCETVNKWMDELAAKFPGCPHRNFRHSENDCNSLVLRVLAEASSIDEAKEARRICMLHRIVDRKSDKGKGCEPLSEDY